jgi:hypothetical protein
MCGSKPKKPKAPPKVVERDLKAEQSEAEAKAAAKANEEAARLRSVKGSMMQRRAKTATASTAQGAAKAGGATKLGG